MPTKVLYSLDLLYLIAGHLPSQADLSSLTRCNRILHQITVRVLYRDVKFSVYKVGSLAAAMKTDDSLSQHCRRLSVTLEGSPPEEQRPAFDHWWVSWNREAQERSVNQCLGILRDLAYVIDQCSMHGTLTHFSWDINIVGTAWLTDALRDWRCMTLTKHTLKSLRLILDNSEVLLNGLDLLSQHSFPILSKLVLRVWIARADSQAIRRFLSSFPNVKVLDLRVDYHLHRRLQTNTFAQPEDTLLPDIPFQQLVSLTICAERHNTRVYSPNFIVNHTSLIELDVNALRIRDYLDPSAVLKALLIRTDFISDFPQQHIGNMFTSLTILRIQINLGVPSEEWRAFVNELPRLRCVEIHRTLMVYYEDGLDSDDICNHFLVGIRRDLVEYGVNFKLSRESELPSVDGYTQEICTSTKRLDKLLASCSTVKTLRAFRLSYICEDGDRVDDIIASLPDMHNLDENKIPQALEYVLWQVPWEKRLYRVVREHETTKLIYTGLDHLPDRTYHPNLTWTNESVFDHIDTEEGHMQ